MCSLNRNIKDKVYMVENISKMKKYIDDGYSSIFWYDCANSELKTKNVNLFVKVIIIVIF